MRAELEIRLRASANGRVDASGQLALAPLWCRWDGDTLWIVGSAASPVADDDVRVRLEVGPGVHARVRSVAAMVLYAARDGGSSLRTEIEVAAGASLDWAPEPVIITARADHRSSLVVDVAADSVVRIDEVVLDGRNDGDVGGRLLSESTLRVDGVATLRSSYDTSTPGWRGSGGTDGSRCLGTRLTAPGGDLPASAEPTPTHGSALLRPEGGGAMALALGDDPASVRAELDRLTLDVTSPTGQPRVEMPPSTGMIAPVR